MAMASHMVAICDSCGRHYHLNQRSDLPGEDCGQVWINEDHLGLEFACNTCLNPPEADGNLDDILDLAEAASVAGTTQASLSELATKGQIRHRKTGSGVYLFERRDLVAFVQGRK
ncbi:MAG: hypothetical protein C0506_10265 [Anaerolinea sp.]|nr:hypothetical protein [Anaerolinea sp.]